MRRDRAWQVGGEPGDQTSAAKFLLHNSESKNMLTALEIDAHKVGQKMTSLPAKVCTLNQLITDQQVPPHQQCYLPDWGRPVVLLCAIFSSFHFLLFYPG